MIVEKALEGDANHLESVSPTESTRNMKQNHIAIEIEGSSPNVQASILQLTPKLEKYWFRYPHILRLNVLLLAPILAQVVSGYDGSMMNGLQSVPSWQEYFDKPKGGRLGTMSNGVAIGTLISFPFISLLVDFVGRKRALIIGALIAVVGGVVQGVCQNFSGFLAARIVLGIGANVCYGAGGPLITECAYPTQRASATAMMLASYPCGSFIAALITRACYNTGSLKNSNWAWRIPSLLQAFLPLVQLVIALFTPESPRWLVSKGREQQARDFFVKYHAGGDPDHILVSAQMAEVSYAIEQEKTQKVARWSQWFRTKGMRKRFFIVSFVPTMIQLEGNALISYYLHLILNNVGITDSIQQLNINLGNTVYGFAASLVVACIADRFKRRTMFMTGIGLMLMCYIIFTALSATNQERGFKVKGLAYGTVAFIYLFNGFYHITSCVATPYIMELSPFSLRAKAASMYQLYANIAGLFNNYVNPIAMTAIQWKYYIVWCVWLGVLLVIVYFFFPETQGLALEEIDTVLDTGYQQGHGALDHYLHGEGEKPALARADSENKV